MNVSGALLGALHTEAVAFRPLHTLTELSSGDRITKSEMASEGKFPVFGGGTTPTGLYHKANRSHSVTIARAGSAGFVNYVGSQFWATDVCFTASQIVDGPNIKFVYYFLKSKQGEFSEHLYGGSMPKLDKAYLWNLPVPVPERAIQDEIVRILDIFTELNTQLETGREVRVRQFNYYKAELLAPKSHWVSTTLADIGRVAMCKRVLKEQTSPAGEIPFYKIGTFGSKPDAYIETKLFEHFRSKYSYPKKGDILLSASGTIGRRVTFDGLDSYFQDSNIIWLEHDGSKVLNRFLYHWYSTVEWKTEGGTISRLYNSNMLATPIHIPPLREQSEIVEVLDKFELLACDSNMGLPAEIEARQSQYEYFRDQLLNFKES